MVFSHFVSLAPRGRRRGCRRTDKPTGRTNAKKSPIARRPTLETSRWTGGESVGISGCPTRFDRIFYRAASSRCSHRDALVEIPPRGTHSSAPPNCISLGPLSNPMKFLGESLNSLDSPNRTARAGGSRGTGPVSVGPGGPDRATSLRGSRRMRDSQYLWVLSVLVRSQMLQIRLPRARKFTHAFVAPLRCSLRPMRPRTREKFVGSACSGFRNPLRRDHI